MLTGRQTMTVRAGAVLPDELPSAALVLVVGMVLLLRSVACRHAEGALGTRRAECQVTVVVQLTGGSDRGSDPCGSLTATVVTVSRSGGSGRGRSGRDGERGERREGREVRSARATSRV
ncbi:hypothetical protein Aca07nite_84620 [Actinoplanes capillaceus]|uniref:Secreted protein n=1 Tax=Actinoplanes campanulatus TaxID=113559 RepID=A0ABQ3WY18_9ACTN|nr:hypothetical protein Aca07nite_84620 [Actinoplanes capillaceus]